MTRHDYWMMYQLLKSQLLQQRMTALPQTPQKLAIIDQLAHRGRSIRQELHVAQKSPALIMEVPISTNVKEEALYASVVKLLHEIHSLDKKLGGKGIIPVFDFDKLKLCIMIVVYSVADDLSDRIQETLNQFKSVATHAQQVLADDRLSMEKTAISLATRLNCTFDTEVESNDVPAPEVSILQRVSNLPLMMNSLMMN